MNYTFSLLKTKAACQKMIGRTVENKEKLAEQIEELLKLRADASLTSVKIKNKLAIAEGSLEANQESIGDFPEGPAKDEIDISVKKSEYNIAQLERQNQQYDEYALLEMENKINFVEGNMDKLDDFIILLTDHMNTIPV